jgi:hypothetical protein
VIHLPLGDRWLAPHTVNTQQEREAFFIFLLLLLLFAPFLFCFSCRMKTPPALVQLKPEMNRPPLQRQITFFLPIFLFCFAKKKLTSGNFKKRIVTRNTLTHYKQTGHSQEKYLLSSPPNVSPPTIYPHSKT